MGLDTVAEILRGETMPEDVPRIDVCKHKGHWHCCSGNRRLAAFRLVHMFRPAALQTIRVRPIAKSEKFMRGFTTHLNVQCNGKWVKVRPSGKIVGSVADANTFGLEELKKV